MTKNKKINSKYTIKSILLGIVATLIVTMSLLNFPFKRYSKELELHYTKHNEILKSRDKALSTLNTKLGTTLTIEEYKVAFNKTWLSYKTELKEYKIKKKELLEEHSFLGRANFKFWIFQFGLVLLGFYFSIKSLVDDYSKKIRTGHEIISLTGILVSFFWLYFLFFKTALDFYTRTYIFYEIIISIAVCFLISKLVKYYITKDNIIQNLIDLILRIKVKHYRKMAVNALYAERNDKSILTTETVKEQTNAFDSDVSNTINSLLK